MKIAFIGVGNVGAPLADHLQKLGHSVAISARDPNSQSVQAALRRNAHFEVKTPIEAVKAAEVVFLLKLCQELGSEPVDTGKLAMSLHLEHMTLLWIQMARINGLGSGFVWAMLRK